MRWSTIQKYLFQKKKKQFSTKIKVSQPKYEHIPVEFEASPRKFKR